MRLRRVPKVRAAAGEPDVYVGIGISVVTGDTHHTRIVLLGLRDAIEKGAKFQRNHLDAHAELLQIVLEERSHFGAIRVGGAGENAELHRLAAGILQRGFAIGPSGPGEAGFFQQSSSAIEGTRRMGEIRVAPTFVAGGDQTPYRGAATLIDEADDGLAISGGGNCLAKLYFTEPFLFAMQIGGGFLAEVTQVEEEKIVFETRPGVGDFVPILLAGEHGKVFGAELANQIGFAGLEFEDLSIGVGDEEEDQFVEIREAVALGVRFPVVRVAFEDQALPGYVFFQTERTESGPLICRAAEGSELAEFAFLKRLFEKMARKNGHAVEEAFTGAVGFGYLKADSLWVGLSNDDWFATDNQEVAF